MTKGYNLNAETVKEPEKEIKKKDSRLTFLLVQIVAAAVAVLFAVCTKAIGGEVYNAVKTWYVENFGEETTVNTVLGEEVTLTEKIETQMLLSAKGSNVDINTMALPISGTVTSTFGYRVHPINGEYLKHKGIDIAAETGTEISSALDGVVVQNSYSNSYGNFVEIKHSDTLSTLYAHCSKITVEQGQTVEKGDTVALVGSTGVSTGPHVHFEIRVNGDVIDPEWIVNF